MQSFVFILFAAVALVHNASAYVISAPVCGCGSSVISVPSLISRPSIISTPPTVLTAPSTVLTTAPSTIIQTSSLANNLADTLSLLTVSSLIADSLTPDVIVPVGLPINTCGCGSRYSYIL